MSRVRVYCAVSLDGYLAGPDGDLSWLDHTSPIQAGPGSLDFDAFLGEIGCIVMGRTTYDVVAAMDVDWPYGDVPVLVPTHRPLTDAPASVRPVAGSIEALCTLAQGEAGTQDVYLDGGSLITQALDAGLVDEMVITTVPIWIGAGIPLYQGSQRHRLHVESTARYGPYVQTWLRPVDPC